MYLWLSQIILKLIAFRLKYFTHKFEVFDGIIVTLSFVLDWASLYMSCNCNNSPYNHHNDMHITFSEQH